MKIDTYRQALRYAGFRDWRTHRDVVHDAFVNYHRQTGKDLFDQEVHYVIRVINLTLRTKFRDTYFMWRGKLYPKVYVMIASGSEDKYRKDKWMESRESAYCPTSQPYDATAIDVDRAETKLKRRLTPIQLFVYNKLKDGYTQLEISVQRGGTAQAVHAKVLEIKKKFNELGIQTKIKKVNDEEERYSRASG